MVTTNESTNFASNSGNSRNQQTPRLQYQSSMNFSSYAMNAKERKLKNLQEIMHNYTQKLSKKSRTKEYKISRTYKLMPTHFQEFESKNKYVSPNSNINNEVL